MLNNVVEIARQYMSLTIKEGDTVLDATCGNGYDTLFLSQLVGSSGSVYAFDIQKEAIERTKRLLSENECNRNVSLILDSHENIGRYVKSIQFAVFNLGYLPNSDKSIVTNAESTVNAVSAAIQLLNSAGLIVVCCYLGHTGGITEFESLLESLNKYDCDCYNIVVLKHLIRHDDAPRMILIEKK